MQVLDMMEQGDHAGRHRRHARVPEGVARGSLRPLPDDGRGARRARAARRPASGSASTRRRVGTGQVHVWFERPGGRLDRVSLGEVGTAGTRREGGVVAEARPIGRPAATPAGEEYERLGGKKLSLVDVLAQSVGLHGAGVQRGVHHPADHRRERGGAWRRHVGAARRAARRRSACSRSGGSSRSTRSASTRRDRSTTTSRTGSAGRSARPSGWLYYAGTIILTIGLGVLLGGYVHDNLWPTLFNGESPLPIWLWDVIFAAGPVRRPVLRRADLDPRAAHARAGLDRRGADLLHHRDRRRRRRQRPREGVRPDADARRLQRDPVRRPLRRVDLRRVRDRGEPGRGDRGAEALDPAGGPRRRRRSSRSST